MSLQIDEDVKFLKIMWIVERAGWVLMFLIIIAALLGYFGKGPLSKSVSGKENQEFWVEYDRYERHGSPGQIKFHISVRNEKQDKVKLSINKEFIENVNLQSIKPQPDKVTAAPDGNYYTFNVSGSGKLTIIYEYEPNTYGNLTLNAISNDKNRLMLNQWIYP